MPGAILEITRSGDLQPFVVNGAPVHESFRQLRADLRMALSEPHALLFAQPEAEEESGDIRWYAPADGASPRLRDLAPAQRAAVEARLAQLVRDIARRAERLQLAANEVDRAAGRALALALELPGDEHIFVVGGEPVIAAWGHVPPGPAVPKRLLHTLARKGTEPPPRASVATAGSAGANASALGGALHAPAVDDLMAAFDGRDPQEEARKKAEEEARQKAEEAARKQRAAAEAFRKLEEQERQRRADEEAQKQAEEEERKQRAAEAEAARRAEEQRRILLSNPPPLAGEGREGAAQAAEAARVAAAEEQPATIVPPPPADAPPAPAAPMQLDLRRLADEAERELAAALQAEEEFRRAQEVARQAQSEALRSDPPMPSAAPSTTVAPAAPSPPPVEPAPVAVTPPAPPSPTPEAAPPPEESKATPQQSNASDAPPAPPAAEPKAADTSTTTPAAAPETETTPPPPEMPAAPVEPAPAPTPIEAAPPADDVAIASTAPPATAAAIGEPIEFAVSHPWGAGRGTPFEVEAWVFRADDRREAQRRATDPELAGLPPAPVAGAPRPSIAITVTLELPPWLAAPSEQTLAFDGTLARVAFAVTPDADVPGGKVAGTLTFHARGLRIAQRPVVLSFASAPLPQKRFLTTLGVRNAFAAFAEPDRGRVLARIAGLEAVGVSVLMAPEALAHGAPYPAHRLAQIAAADRLLLFWSRHAKASAAVEREWRHALAQRGLDFIAPVPLADPGKLVPPAELAAEPQLAHWTLAWRDYEQTLPSWRRLLLRFGR